MGQLENHLKMDLTSREQSDFCRGHKGDVEKTRADQIISSCSSTNHQLSPNPTSRQNSVKEHMDSSYVQKPLLRTATSCSRASCGCVNNRNRRKKKQSLGIF